ncbi:Hypothetical protein R9X50_00489300 [Acrodontium crateriforme]|uniref:F-box domain-containing protein n=1 Tax=Acrodontium crateriforme TaxID=150365 RepID=A0AAQ3RD00_9PEZI|nr:Hypothetical protein R9X50_00489300 [Acrodontium crateriforme]
MYTPSCRSASAADNSLESTGAVQRATAAFDAVTCPKDRTKVLHHIVKCLHRTERSDLICHIDGLHDPFNVLPIELVLQIMEYLPMFCVWDLRLVSRRWQKVLASSMATRAALRRWDTHDPSDSAGPTSNDTLTSRVRHMQAMRLGRPFFVLRLDKDTTVTVDEGLDVRAMCLKGSRLAYIRSGRNIEDRVIVRNLVSGDVFSMHGDAREKITRVVLTSHLVAFTTSDAYLYVTSLSDPARHVKQLRLPSAPTSLSGDANSLVMLISPWPSRPGLLHTTAVYSHDNQSLKCFAFRRQWLSSDDGESRMRPFEAVISSAQQTIDIISLGPGSSKLPSPLASTVPDEAGDDFYLGSMRFPLQTMYTTDLCQPDSESCVHMAKLSLFGALNDILPIGHQGSMNIPIVSLWEPDITLSMPLTFDRDRGKVNGQYPISLSRPCYPSVVCSAIQRWKDIYFDVRVGIMRTITKASARNAKDPGFTHDLWPEKRSAVMFHSRHPDCAKDLGQGNTHDWDDEINTRRFWRRNALVNDTFLIRSSTYETHIEVYSFDENIRPHGAQSTGLWSDVTPQGHSPYMSLSGDKPYDRILAELRASNSELGENLPEGSGVRDTSYGQDSI